jgi:hypothetical protein
MRFCVTDGATEAFDSGRWAKLLARCWVRNDRLLTPSEFEPWLATLGAHLETKWTRRQLPWYAEEKARSGAFAAFVGLAFLPTQNSVVWQAIALGDCCLLQLRGGELLQSFPLSVADDFGFHPTLIPSSTARQQIIIDDFKLTNGTVENDDVFLLLSDAVAAWYLKRLDDEDTAKLHEFASLIANSDVGALADFVSKERQLRSMRNDDVAVLRITIS